MALKVAFSSAGTSTATALAETSGVFDFYKTMQLVHRYATIRMEIASLMRRSQQMWRVLKTDQN
jgi:hypothetical protein